MAFCCWRAFVVLGLCGMLSRCADPPPADPPQALLQAQFLDAERSQDERLQSGYALVQSPEGRAFLVGEYWTRRRPLVQALVDSLTRSEPAQAARLLAGLMADAGGESKLHFESRLVRLGDAAIAALVELGETTTDWQTSMRLLDALGKLRASQGVEVMRAHLLHENDWVRLVAAQALGNVGGGEAVTALMATLNDTSDTVVAAALVGLGKAGDRRAFAACARRLKHSNPRVRASAVAALDSLGGEEVRALLLPMQDDPDSGVRLKAQAALARF